MRAAGLWDFSPCVPPNDLDRGFDDRGPLDGDVCFEYELKDLAVEIPYFGDAAELLRDLREVQ